MKTYNTQFFIQKIIIDYLPEKESQVSEIFKDYGFGPPVSDLMEEIKDLLHPGIRLESIDRKSVRTATFLGIKNINDQVKAITVPKDKHKVKDVLSTFFNAVIAEMNGKSPEIFREIFPEIREALRLAVMSEGYDEEDMMSYLNFLDDDFHFPTDIANVLEEWRVDNVPPTRFITDFTEPQCKYIGELLQQHGVTCRADQFHGLFNRKGHKACIPVKCFEEKLLYFMHFMRDLIFERKLVRVINGNRWEAIKEAFVDSKGKVFEKSIRQYYNREIKRNNVKDLINSILDAIWKDFYKKYPDAPRTHGGRKK